MRANPRVEEAVAEAVAVGVEAAGLQADAEALAGEARAGEGAHRVAEEDSVDVAEGVEVGEDLAGGEVDDSPEAGEEVERGAVFPFVCPVEKKEV